MTPLASRYAELSPKQRLAATQALLSEAATCCDHAARRAVLVEVASLNADWAMALVSAWTRKLRVLPADAPAVLSQALDAYLDLVLALEPAPEIDLLARISPSLRSVVVQLARDLARGRPSAGTGAGTGVTSVGTGAGTGAATESAAARAGAEELFEDSAPLQARVGDLVRDVAATRDTLERIRAELAQAKSFSQSASRYAARARRYTASAHQAAARMADARGDTASAERHRRALGAWATPVGAREASDGAPAPFGEV